MKPRARIWMGIIILTAVGSFAAAAFMEKSLLWLSVADFAALVLAAIMIRTRVSYLQMFVLVGVGLFTTAALIAGFRLWLNIGAIAAMVLAAIAVRAKTGDLRRLRTPEPAPGVEITQLSRWGNQKKPRQGWAVFVEQEEGRVEVSLHTPLGFFDFDGCRARWQLISPAGRLAFGVLDPSKEELPEKVDIDPWSPYAHSIYHLPGVDLQQYVGNWRAAATFFVNGEKVATATATYLVTEGGEIKRL